MRLVDGVGVKIMKRNIKISYICTKLGLNYIGTDISINTLALCNRTTQYENALSYVTNEKYVEIINENTAIKCLVVSSENLSIYEELIKTKGRSMTFIISFNPETVFYNIHDFLIDKTDFYGINNEPTSFGANCNIAGTAVIQKGVKVGNNVKIGENSVIKSGSILEDNVTIGCNTVIGAEGFQIIQSNHKNRRIRHCGGILVSVGAYIGDNVTACNSLFEGVTYIGKNVMIDNLVYIGHNGYIGNGAVITAGVILCGSAIIKEEAWVGVNSSVLNRVVVGESSMIGIGSVVTRDIPSKSLAYGVPAKKKSLNSKKIV